MNSKHDDSVDALMWNFATLRHPYAWDTTCGQPPHLDIYISPDTVVEGSAIVLDNNQPLLLPEVKHKHEQIIIVEKPIHTLEPREATYDSRCDGWFVGCPGCPGKGNLTGHTVIYIDKMLTVSPSILCSCGAHYFIENNQIRWC